MMGLEAVPLRRPEAVPSVAGAWAEVTAVESFVACSPTDYFRVYPRLLPRNGGVPDVLRRCLARRVSAIRTRPHTRRSGDLDHRGGSADVRNEAGGSGVGARDRQAGAAVHALLSAVLAEIEADDLRAFDPEDAALFAHGSGIHPAYLWPEGLLSHECYSALGWLGHHQRGNAVAMPPDVADYVADTVVWGADGVPLVREPLLARFLPRRAMIEELWQAYRGGRDVAAAKSRPTGYGGEIRNRIGSDPGPVEPIRPRSFAINGRFLTQPVTGVQRYAREIVSAMDALLKRDDAPVHLYVPPGAAAVPALSSIRVEPLGRVGGQLWEQAILPATLHRPSLHLCNTAPVLSRGTVVCLHDANVFIRPESYSRAFRAYYRALQPWIARRAVKVATVSRDAASQLARYLPIEARDIAVLPNGHEHALRWDPSRSTVSQTWSPRRPFVLLLASQARHKNVGRILGLAEAVDAMRLDLVVVGRQAPIFSEAAVGSAPNLVRLGAVADDDLAWLLSRALCLAFPSLTEGFGLPVVEAMAWGCPVVSSDRASLPEVCGDAALMASPDADGDWLAHFSRLAASRGLSEELRGRGHAQMSKFSWTASARGYLDLFAI